jgi:tRNA-splicing ligase RtcB
MTFRYPLRKISEVEYQIPVEAKPGMNVPVTIFANEELLSKMTSDRTIDQAVNVSMLRGLEKHVVVLPDGHEGYGFPVGGVAAADSEEGVISPGGIGYDINCLPAETRVLMEHGYTKSIRDIKIGANVVCIENFRSKPTGLNLWLWRKGELLYHIRTESGLILKATPDHRVMTRDGMKEASKLFSGVEIATCPFDGVEYEKPPGTLILSEQDFSKTILVEVKEKGLVPLSSDSWALPYLTKLVGYFLGNGTYDGEITRFYGSKEGMEELRRDILFLGFVPSEVRSRISENRQNQNDFLGRGNFVEVSSKSFRAFIEKLGGVPGRRTFQDIGIPRWLAKQPKWIKRLFLAAYFGAAMNKPNTVDGHNFEPPSTSLSTDISRETNCRKFLEDVAGLLREFDVRICGISAKRFGDTVRVKLQLSEKPQSLINLWSRIGYVYCPSKQRLALAGVSWLRRKQLAAIHERMYNGGVEVVTHTNDSLLAQLVILDASYGMDDRSGENTSYCGSKNSPSSAAVGLQTFEEWKERSQEGEIVWERVEAVDVEPYEGMVYDIGVDSTSHNFIANGVVVSNCGVRLLRTSLTEKEVRPKLRQLLKELFQAVPSGLGHRGALSLTISELDEVLSQGMRWAVSKGYGWKQDPDFCEENGHMKFSDPNKVSTEAKKRGTPQLGSLGSGNHFLEVEVVDEVFDNEAAQKMGIKQKGQVCVLIHSGSRGLGHQVCSDYLKIMESAMKTYNITLPDRELACAPTNTPEAENYRYAMGCALNFAWVNRQMMTHSIRKTFEKVFKVTAEDLDMALVYDVAHNICKLEEHVIDGQSKRVFVHRKGATRAFPKGSMFIPEPYRSVGQPVLIPGSMGTASWVLLGQEKAMQVSFGSTAHGAGRFMSRKAATRSYPAYEVKRSLESRGIFVEAASKEGVSEEAPGAYKDVDAVADVSHRVGIATKVVRLTPIGVVKG